MQRIKDILKRFRQNTYLISLLALASGTGLGQLISVCISPVLTRIYAPEDFGIFSVYLSIFSMLLIASSLKLELTIPIVKTERRATTMFISAFFILVTITGVILTATILWGLTVSVRTGHPGLEALLMILPFAILGGGLYKILNFYALRILAYKRIAITRLQQSLTFSATQVLFGLIGPSAFALALAHASARFVGCLSLWRIARLPVLAERQRFSVRFARKLIYRYRRYPMISTVAGIVNAMGVHVPPVLIAFFYGPALAGFVALSNRIMSQPLTLIGQSVSQVYTGEASAKLRINPRTLHKFYVQNTRSLLVTGILIIIPICLVIHPAVILIFGAQWADTATVIQILATMYIAQMVVVPLAQTLSILERQTLQLLWDCIRLPMVVASLTVPMKLGLNWKVALLSYSITSAVAYTLLWCMGLHAMRQLHAESVMGKSGRTVPTYRK